MSDILQVIDDIVKERTFSLDALDAINSIKSKAEALEKALIAAQDYGAQMKRERDSMSREILAANAELSAFKTREGELVKREQTHHALAQQAAVADAVSKTWEKSFGLVFKNTTVRENVVGGASQPGGFYASENRTVTRETE